MKPQFALSLSFDGIRLMHRVKGGWHLVGEVALDAPDLALSLATLRKTALALDPAGLRTKLLIPNDQIKYLAIDSTRTNLDDIHAALDGATPYDVQDLVIDFDRTGGRTHIAAVARETLTEAEAFATEHKFAPVCYAAVAEPLTFSKEVFFGPTAAAPSLIGEGETVTADAEPVTVVGMANLPVAALAYPEPEASSALEDAPEPIAAEKPETVKETPAPELAPQTAKPEVSEPDISPATQAEPASAKDDAPTPPDTKEPAALPVEPENPVADEPVFTSRAKPLTALRTDHTTPPPSVPTPTKNASSPPPSAQEPLFTRRLQPPTLSLSQGATVSLASTPTEAKTVVSKPDIPSPAPAVPAAVVTAQTPAAMPAPPITGTPEAAANPVVPKPLAAPERPPASTTDGFRVPRNTSEKQPKPAKTKETAAFATPTSKVGGKPRFLGLILTAALLLFLALIALWASTLSDADFAAWFGGDTPAMQPEADAVSPNVQTATLDTAAPNITDDTAPLPETAVTEATAPVIPSPENLPATTDPDSPVTGMIAALPTPPPGQVLSPAEADRIYAATGVWQRAPRLPILPTSTAMGDVGTADTLAAATRIAQPTLPPLDNVAPDPDLVPPVNPLPAGTIVPLDDRGFIQASADGTLLPTGVVIYASAPASIPPLRPGSPEAEAAAIAATQNPDIAEVTDAINPAIIEAADGLVVIAGRPASVPPARPTFDLSTYNLTPEATEPDAASADPDADTATNAEGLVVISGKPPRVPPLRPGTPEVTPEAASDTSETDIAATSEDIPPGAVSIAAFRPAVRPDALVPPSLLPPAADPALAGFRPTLRPDGLAPAPTEEDPAVAEALAQAQAETTSANDINSVIASLAAAAPPSPLVNATSRAIVASPRPDTRPRNFATVVSRAREAASRQQQTTTTRTASTQAATQAAPVANTAAQPSGAIPGSVAQAATMDGAMNLGNVNLIGVYGRPNNRRALVRMGNGQFVKVEIGSSLNGGQVTAIGDNALNYVVRGTMYSLQIPSG